MTAHKTSEERTVMHYTNTNATKEERAHYTGHNVPEASEVSNATSMDYLSLWP